MLFVELQRVNQTQHFVDVTAQRQVVNHLVTNNAVGVDQEGTTQGNAFVRVLNTVRFLISRLMSATMAYLTGPMPPWSTGVLRHALWTNSESKETPTTSTPRFWNSS